jgi:uncharacterized protein RhaS with RHS repeats
MYAPQLGRFIGRDPIDYDDGINLYEYARSNPPLYRDSTGLYAVCDELFSSCMDECYKQPLPYPYNGYRGKIRRWARYSYCETKCQAEYMACEAEEAAKEAKNKVEGTCSDAASWIADHKGVAVGTIVVIAGVTYVVATGGAGALTLIPLVAAGG